MGFFVVGSTGRQLATTILTIGLLLAAGPPMPRLLALIPIAWAGLGGQANIPIKRANRPDVAGIWHHHARIHSRLVFEGEI